MQDKNGFTITEGQYLKITGCKIKGDNGIYRVEKEYRENDFCLHKVNQNGEDAQTKYNLYFLDTRHDLERDVTIIQKEELKQAAKEVKEYVNGITSAETVYSFVRSAVQEVENGKFIKFIKSVLLVGHINRFSGTYAIKSINKDNSVSLHLCGKRGEEITYNVNNSYGYTPIALTFKASVIKQLFEENYIEVLERISTTKGEAQAAKQENEKPIQEEAEQPNEKQEEQPQPEEEKTEAIKPEYHTINEQAAKHAKGMWSFSDYINGSETADYKRQVDKVYNLAAIVAEQKPERAEEAYNLAARFSRKYAEWKNTGFQIELMCPSVMISGGSNFPVRKKEKQNKRRDKHMEEYNYIMGIQEKIESILNGREVIKSNDDNAIEQLQSKVDSLKADLERYKAMNAYYRKHNTMNGFSGLTEEQAAKMNQSINAAYSWDKCPAPSYELTSIRNKIKAAEGRISEIQRLKTTAEQKNEQQKPAYASNVCEVKENAENMRIQLFFESKPSEDIRNVLKSHGFRWAPSEGAWQRQLTDNARYSTKQALKQIEEMESKTA